MCREIPLHSLNNLLKLNKRTFGLLENLVTNMDRDNKCPWDIKIKEYLNCKSIATEYKHIKILAKNKYIELKFISELDKKHKIKRYKKYIYLNLKEIYGDRYEDYEYYKYYRDYHNFWRFK